MKKLPRLMIAPNGARRTKSDHREIPVTIPEIVETAIGCHIAGADGLHAHVRNDRQEHVLDAGLYRELIAELKYVLPNLFVQITTEAVGKYSPSQQRAVVEQTRPEAVSVALSEMTAELPTEEHIIGRFYHDQSDAGVAIQHILYTADELVTLERHIKSGLIPSENLQLLFVLGRYTPNQQSQPGDLAPFLQTMLRLDMDADWAVCAFGKQETQCLIAGYAAGGKARVGFENSLWNADGRLAKNDAQRVLEIKAMDPRPAS